MFKILRTGTVDSKKTPDTIGRYNVIRKIGRGAMGVVFLAHDPYIDRQVAIKTQLAANSGAPSNIEKNQQKFFNEVRAVGKLMHPHIVSAYDAMCDNGMCHLIMEYIDGTNLKEFCTEKTLLPLDDILKYAFQCAKAIEYAHQNGVVHRDIKPGNIMLSTEGNVKISDFGIAHVQGIKDTSMSKRLAGTVSYMSPEQINNEDLTPQSDLFSLGVVLYELLTGKKPFKAENDYATFFKIANENPEPLGQLRQDIPESLERIVMRALEKDLAKRYQTGQQLAAELSVAFDNLRFSGEEINSKEKFNQIKKIQFFKDFTSSELAEVLKTTQWLKYETAETVITEGEIEDSFYIIVVGEAMVLKQGKQLAVLKQGDCFGEMAYLGTSKRTATIKTLGDTILMKINASIIEQMSMSTQLRFYKIFSHTLIQRLSRTNKLLSNNSS